jgi:prepilin-type N-terminal cleavage/methylation domain-containing protein
MKIARAFTLLEMLCATAVVSVVLVVTAQLVNSAGAWSGAARRMLIASAQTRATMDRLAGDLSARISLPGNNLEILKTPGGNDALQMFSDVRNRSATARFSAVTYKVENPAAASGRNEPQLQRIVTPVEWNEEPQTLPGTAAAGGAADVFAEGCFRLEVAFLLKSGDIRESSPPDPGEIAALIVTVAALDAATRAKCSAEELRDLAAALADAEDGRAPLEAWSAANLTGPGGKEARFAQKIFPLAEGFSF